jgi:hypothetical protein
VERVLMIEEIGVEKGSNWAKFLKKHWHVFAAFIIAAVLLFAGAVYVFLWFTGNAQSTGLVPASLGLWSMANVVFFFLHAAFWELVLIGIPVAVGAILGWQWWRRLPEQEKQEYHFSRKGSKPSRAGGAISPLLFIAFAIKVYVDGNWNVAISSYTLNYVVGSMFTILIWIVAIAAVPAAIGLIWWIRHEMNTP